MHLSNCYWCEILRIYEKKYYFKERISVEECWTMCIVTYQLRLVFNAILLYFSDHELKLEQMRSVLSDTQRKLSQRETHCLGKFHVHYAQLSCAKPT